jgi:excisionase family DNA binding protein
VSLRYVPVAVVSRLLRISNRGIRSFIVSRRIPARRHGGHWRILRTDLDQFIALACAKYGATLSPLAATSLITVREVAETIGQSERTIRLAAQSQTLIGFKIGRSWRFWRTDVEAFARKKEQSTVSPKICTSLVSIGQRKDLDTLA